MLNFFDFKDGKRKTAFYCLLNLLLAVLIYYNAELGRLLGIQGQPLAISLVWPATGFSLAALLLFGVNVWTGIFLGNFAYNFLTLFAHAAGVAAPLLTAIIISFGSLFQALVGYKIMKSYTSSSYFGTLKDVFIFLIPVGLLTNLIASTIGVAALHVYGDFSWGTTFIVWWTFWLGDSMGVYIFTPLLVIWSMKKPVLNIKKHRWLALIMTVAFIVISFLVFVEAYPLPFLFFPLSIWITYQFRIHGATLAIFLITLIAIISTSFGYGWFSYNSQINPLLVLIIFLDVTVATCLIVSAIINERTAAWDMLKAQNISLQQTVETHLEELTEVQSAVYIRKKLLVSLGNLKSILSQQIQEPLQKITELSRASLVCLSQVKDVLTPNKLNPETSFKIDSNCEILLKNLQKITNLDEQANQIVNVFKERFFINYPDRLEVKYININTLLNSCLEESQQLSHFTFTTIKNYDKSIPKIFVLSEDFKYAILQLIISSLISMKEKKDKLGMIYVPILEIVTKNQEEKIEIVIRDNGKGISEEHVKSYFHSFTSPVMLEENFAINLSFAYDIIVHVHSGEIKIVSKEDDYQQFTVTLFKAK